MGLEESAGDGIRAASTRSLAITQEKFRQNDDMAGLEF